jgi:hypothetical protein
MSAAIYTSYTHMITVIYKSNTFTVLHALEGGGRKTVKCDTSGYHGFEYKEAFWDVTSSSIVEVDQCFGGAYCLHHQGDKYFLHPRKLSS